MSGIYNDDGGYHYQWFHFAMRERMLQATGNTDNHVMWRGNPINADQAWKTFEQWLEAIAADTSVLSQRERRFATSLRWRRTVAKPLPPVLEGEADLLAH